MSSDPRTRDYVARQTAAGRTKKEIIRLLKRALVREIFRCPTTTVAVPETADLRPARQAKNIPLAAVAHHFGVWPAVISTSNAAPAATTSSQPPTATGSPPINDRPRHNRDASPAEIEEHSAGDRDAARPRDLRP
ncbi:hypothetical protein [Kitasatospora sp. MMS16-BH015]|uniref:hypothetical protein n=1 Tax=Kitasatospora sp. MMS16-BH015 TaxID=2018025 RepID=UPI00131A5401